MTTRAVCVATLRQAPFLHIAIVAGVAMLMEKEGGAFAAEAGRYRADILASMDAAAFRQDDLTILPIEPDTRRLLKLSNFGGGDYYGPKDLRETRGAPVKVGRSKAAQDQQVAVGLWDLSEDLTVVHYPTSAPNSSTS